MEAPWFSGAMDDVPKPDGTLGQYANCLQIGTNAFEFVLDFGQYYPEESSPHLCARIITSPTYAKTFLRALDQAIACYEQTHGSIPE